MKAERKFSPTQCYVGVPKGATSSNCAVTPVTIGTNLLYHRAHKCRRTSSQEIYNIYLAHF